MADCEIVSLARVLVVIVLIIVVRACYPGGIPLPDLAVLGAAGCVPARLFRRRA